MKKAPGTPPRPAAPAARERTGPVAKRRLTRGLAVAAWGDPKLKGNLLGSPASLWFFVFLLIPLFFILAYGFAKTTTPYNPTFDAPTLDNYASVLNPFGIVVGLTATTILYSIATTVTAAALGYPVSYFVARKVGDSSRGILVGLLVIPFWISFVVQVYALYPFVIPGGFIDGPLQDVGLGGLSSWILGNFGLHTTGIVVPVLVYIWLPYMILPLFTSLAKIDEELILAAADLGAGPWKTFWNVTFPLSFRGLLTGSILIFITALGSFVEINFFAGNRTIMVGQFIYSAYYSPYAVALPTGAAASIFILAFAVPILVVFVRYADTADVGGAGLWMRLMDLGTELLRPMQASLRAREQTRTADSDGGSPASQLPVRGPVERAIDWTARRLGRPLLSAYTGLVLLAFYIPMAIIIIFSFNYSSDLVTFSSFSLRWYIPDTSSVGTDVRALFGDPEMISGLTNSFIVGFASTGISLGLGTLAAMAIARYPFKSKGFLNVMLYTGLVIPSVVLGLSISLFILFLNDYILDPVLGVLWERGLGTIIVGHATFSIPIVIIVLLASLKEFDRSLEEAAMNLGADEITTFLRVTLPVLKPALVSAALLAFTFSFSELIVTLFLQGQGIATLPVVFWGTLTRKVPTPELNAASTLIVFMSIAFVLVTNKVQRGGALFRI